MPQTEIRRDSLIPESTVTRKFAIARLAIGAAQGIALYFLYQAVKANTWPATSEFLFAPLLLVCVLVPVMLISSLGHLENKQAAMWVLVAVAVISLLGFYDIWRGGVGYNFRFNQNNSAHVRYPSELLFVFVTAGFYIAHYLVLAGAIEHRRIAT